MSSSVHHEGHVTKATVHMLHVAADSAVLRKAVCSTFSASCFSICLCVTSCREGCYTRNLFSFTMALRCKLRGKLLHVRKAKTLTTTTTTTTTTTKTISFVTLIICVLCTKCNPRQAKGIEQFSIFSYRCLQ